MALSSADEQWNSIPKLGSGKARTRWRRDGRAWFSIVVAKQCTELLRSRKENEMKYELVMGEKAATIDAVEDMVEPQERSE